MLRERRVDRGSYFGCNTGAAFRGAETVKSADALGKCYVQGL
jgi:hypothetical protein